MITCKEMAEVLHRAAVEFAAGELVRPTEVLMQELAHDAWGFIGTYQSGWAPLKPETIARKATGDTPLLETGEMRDSIEHRAMPLPDGAFGEIGSNDPVALWQEVGTKRGIPPRPFLSLAMSRSEAPAMVLFGEFAVKVLSGK